MSSLITLYLGISDAGPDEEAVSGALADVEAVGTQDWVIAVGIFITSCVLAVLVNRFGRKLLSRSIGSGFAAILTSRIIAYLVFILGVFYALRWLDVEVGPLIGALGLSGLVLALALQKVAENFVGAMILQTRRPFTIGDTVELGDHRGVVADIDSRTVVLRGLDGSQIRVPNGKVLAEPIVNLTREPLRRSELKVGVAYDTNLESATDVIRQATTRVARVKSSPAPLIVLQTFGASSIDFSIFFWHNADVPSELTATHDLMLAIHQAFAAEGITIAFPQLVVWPSHEPNDNPYDRHPGEIFVDHPISARPNSPTGDKSGKSLFSRWRSP